MLLKAIHRLVDHRGTYMPGDIFTPDTKEDEERLLRLGAAVPARKIITIEIDMTSNEKGEKNGL